MGKKDVRTKKVSVTNSEFSVMDPVKKEHYKLYAKLIDKSTSDKPKFVDKALRILNFDSPKKQSICRLIQVCLKHSNQAQQDYITNQLKHQIVDLAQGKYSFFVAKKVFLVSDRQELLTELLNNTPTLIKTIYGFKFLDYLYNKSSSSKVLRSILGGTVSADSQDLQGLQNLIRKIFKKNLHTQTLSLYLIHQFAKNCDQQTKLAVLEPLSQDIPELMNSKEGCKIVMMFLKEGSKDMKNQIKSFANKIVQEIPNSPYSYQLIIALFQEYPIEKLKKLCRLLKENMGDLVQSASGVKLVIALLIENLGLQELSTYIGDAIVESIGDIMRDNKKNEIIVLFSILISQKKVSHKKFLVSLSRMICSREFLNNVVTHRVFKKIISQESQLGLSLVSLVFLSSLKKADIPSLLKTRGVWVFCCMAESLTIGLKAKKLFSKYKNLLETGQKGEQVLTSVLTSK